MQCYTNEEALASLFINVSTSFFLLLLLIYSAVSLLLKLFHFIGGYPLLQRNEDEYDSAAWFSDEEEEDEEEEEGGEFKLSCNTSYHVLSRDQNPDHLIADIGDDGESLLFYTNNFQDGLNNRPTTEFINGHQTYEHEEEDDQDSNTSSSEEHFSSANVSPYRSESSIEEDDNGVEDLHHDDPYDDDDEDGDEEIGGVSRYDVVEDLVRKQPNSSSTRGPARFQSGLVYNDKSYNGIMISPLRLFTCYI